MFEAVAVTVCVWERVPVCVAVMAPVGEAETVPVAVASFVTVLDPVWGVETVFVAVLAGVGVQVGLWEAVWGVDRVLVRDCVQEQDPDGEGDAVSVAVGLALRLSVPESVGLTTEVVVSVPAETKGCAWGPSDIKRHPQEHNCRGIGGQVTGYESGQRRRTNAEQPYASDSVAADHFPAILLRSAISATFGGGKV